MIPAPAAPPTGTSVAVPYGTGELRVVPGQGETPSAKPVPWYMRKHGEAPIAMRGGASEGYAYTWVIQINDINRVEETFTRLARHTNEQTRRSNLLGGPQMA